MPGDLRFPEPIYQYLLSVSLREHPALQKLREETARHPMARIQIAPDHGQLMGFLIQMLGARRTIEVGVFTGYSSLAVALALPPDGRMVACDVSEEYTATARKYWKLAGVEHKIDLRIQPAIETLRELLDAGEQGKFDFVFIDADKTGYDAYYECALELLRPGGIVMVDNVLWSGRVVDPGDQTPDTVALRAFNRKVHADSRVALSMLTVGDGVTLALKK